MGNITVALSSRLLIKHYRCHATRYNVYDVSAIDLPLTSMCVCVSPDKYKPDPSHAAGSRPEQLCDSDGWPAHRGPVSDEHGCPRGAPG